MDVRNQPESWKMDLDQQHQCKHYLYRGEAIFYGTYSVRSHRIFHFLRGEKSEFVVFCHELVIAKPRARVLKKV